MAENLLGRSTKYVLRRARLGAIEAHAANEQRLLNGAILRTMRQPLIVLDGALVVESANHAFCDLFKVDPDKARGRKIYDLGNGQWNIPEIRTLLDTTLSGQNEVTDFKFGYDFPSLGRRIMMLNAYRMARDGRSDQILLAIEDVTERELARKELEGQKVYIEKIVDSSHDAILVLMSVRRLFESAVPVSGSGLAGWESAVIPCPAPIR
jgi:PAS domain S-box-containing protein